MRPTTIAFLAIGLALLLGGCTGIDASSVDVDLERARFAVREAESLGLAGKYDEALELVERSLNEAPQGSRAARHC